MREPLLECMKEKNPVKSCGSVNTFHLKCDLPQAFTSWEQGLTDAGDKRGTREGVGVTGTSAQREWGE